MHTSLLQYIHKKNHTCFWPYCFNITQAGLSAINTVLVLWWVCTIVFTVPASVTFSSCPLVVASVRGQPIEETLGTKHLRLRHMPGFTSREKVTAVLLALSCFAALLHPSVFETFKAISVGWQQPFGSLQSCYKCVTHWSETTSK